MSKFDEATESKSSHQLAQELVEAHDAADEAAHAPRVVFTKDEGMNSAADWVPPMLRLAQGTTKEVQAREAGIGQYVLSGFPAEDTVLLVPLAVQLNRTRNAVDENGRINLKVAPLCVAPTGVHGVGDPGIECAKCPLKDWGKKDPKTGKSAPPSCTAGINVRAYSITHKMLVDFQFKGRTFRNGQFIQQQGMMRGYGNFALQFGSKSEQNAKGAWVEPTVIMADIPADEVETAGKLLDMVRGSLVTPDQAIAAIEA